MSRDDKNLLAFVAGLFIAAALLLPGAVWATVVTPTVQGYGHNAITGGYLNNRAGQGQSLFDAAARKYGTTGVANIGSKSLQIPAKLAVKSNVSTIAKAAMRLNPTLLVGSAALLWLIENNFGVENGEVVRTTAGTMYEPVDLLGQLFSDPNVAGAAGCAAIERDYSRYASGFYYCSSWMGEGSGRVMTIHTAPPTTAPATEGDWNSLPEVPDAVVAELPTADYMPDGAPVEPPEYDFEPYDIPTGSPYKKPDGSEWQDGVTVSKSWSNVTNNYTDIKIVNSSTQITNTDGTPVAAPVAEEAPAEEQDQCQKYPDSAACQALGKFEHAIPKKDHVFAFSPENVNMAGSCPADIQILGSALSFAPACGAMSTIKPIVVGMAAVVAAMILFGGMRGAD